MFRSPKFCRWMVAFGLALMAVSVAAGLTTKGPGRKVLAGSRVELPARTTDVTCVEKPENATCGRPSATADGTVLTSRLTTPGTYRLAPILERDAPKATELIVTV